MNKGMLCVSLASSMWVTAQAQTVEAHWLYASPSGTWVESSTALDSTEVAIEFPVKDINPNLFWWHSDDDSTQVHWQSDQNSHLPQRGDVTTSDMLEGEWVVQQVLSNSLLITQGDARRYWPMTQLHLLQWNAGSTGANFALTVVRESDEPSQFAYAWQDHNVRASVNYRLEMTDNPVLQQTLILTNDSPYDITAQGYSYAVNEQPRVVMHEMMSRSQADASAPVSSQSQGVATLVSDQKVSLPAHSSLWLQVASIDLQALEKRYSLSWDTRMQGLQQAESQVTLRTKNDPLPDLTGPIAMGVFDQQLAVLNAHYQPSSEQEATLALGPSPLVTLESTMVAENQWQLTLVNRTNEAASVDLMMSHWNGNRSEKIPMTVDLKARATEVLKVRLGLGDKLRIE